MSDMQNKLGECEFVGQAGNGLVTITMSGKSVVRKVAIDPKVVSSDDIEMLEDLIAAAFNDARQKTEDHIQAETEKMMGGVKLPPGVKLPF